MIIASVAFGIAVDNTIHVMSRYIRAINSGLSQREAIHETMTGIGRTLVFTSVILYFGFSILLISGWLPNMYFGFLGGLIIITALIADLVLLPAVLFLINGSNITNTDTAERKEYVEQIVA